MSAMFALMDGAMLQNGYQLVIQLGGKHLTLHIHHIENIVGL
jgi:hypothetical protein